MTEGGSHPGPTATSNALSRRLWQLIEPIHAVVYFSDATRDAFDDLGLKGFWMGYFAGRFAPLGACSPGVATALSYNFAPALVHRALPDAWARATPDSVRAARCESAAIMLRRLHPDADEITRRSLPLLESAVAGARCEGRPLAGANLGCERPLDPVERLFHAATVLREHRGDGHVAALLSHQVGGVESHLLAAAVEATPQRRSDRLDTAKRSRGWADEHWDAAARGLAERGLIDAHGAATTDGFVLHSRIEAVTDELALQPFTDGLTDAGLGLLPTVLRPLSQAVFRSGLIPMPNPIGLTDPP